MFKNHQRTDLGFTLDHAWPRIIFNSSVFVKVHPEAKPLKYVPATTIFDWILLSVTILTLTYILLFKNWQEKDFNHFKSYWDLVEKMLLISTAKKSDYLGKYKYWTCTASCSCAKPNYFKKQCSLSSFFLT